MAMVSKLFRGPRRQLDALSTLMIQTPTPVLIASAIFLSFLALLSAFLLLHLIAPKPRPVFLSEKTYCTSTPSGEPTLPLQLPCWYDRWRAEYRMRSRLPSPLVPLADLALDQPVEFAAGAVGIADPDLIEPAEVLVSIVIPAYNEALRIVPALEEAVAYMDSRFGRPRPIGTSDPVPPPSSPPGPGAVTPRRQTRRAAQDVEPEPRGGYEILVVDDGSTDDTFKVTLAFAHQHGLHDVLRYVRLERNRGKGGAVIHGFRHARGSYVLFADADGATRFCDLGRLLEACEDIVDAPGRGIAIGSRAHLVGSEAVVKRSVLRNFLMRVFHLILTILTPPATSRIRDTQCGFKLFTRATLPHLVPYMHAEGWIFDIELLMLAESAPAVPVLSRNGHVIGASPGIRVAEVPVTWREIPGSKLNVLDASLRMAFGLAVLRASWMLGVYRRRVA